MVCSLVQELVRELVFKMTALAASVREHKSSKNGSRRPDPQGKTGLIKDRSRPPTNTHFLRFPRKLQKPLASCPACSQDKRFRVMRISPPGCPILPLRERVRRQPWRILSKSFEAKIVKQLSGAGLVPTTPKPLSVPPPFPFLK